jgi:hypothetical protein
MTVNSAMPSFASERHGLFAEGEKLELAIQAKLRRLGYGG